MQSAIFHALLEYHLPKGLNSKVVYLKEVQNVLSFLSFPTTYFFGEDLVLEEGKEPKATKEIEMQSCHVASGPTHVKKGIFSLY